MSFDRLSESIMSVFKNEALYIYRVLSGVDQRYYIWGLLLAVMALLVLFVVQTKRCGKLKGQAGFVDKVMTGLQPSEGLEKITLHLLDVVRSLVEAEGYYFYHLDEKKEQYLLMTVRHKDLDDGKIGPAYSGLMPYAKESYLPPLSLPRRPDSGKRTSIVKDGEVPMLEIPVKGETMLFRVGPVKRVEKGVLRKLDCLGELLAPLLAAVDETEVLRKESERKNVSTQALHNFTSNTLEAEGGIATVMELSINMVQAAGGGFLTREDDKYSADFLSGLEKDTLRIFAKDTQTHELLDKALGANDFCVLDRKEKEFYELPSYLVAAGVEQVVLVRVKTADRWGIVVFWYIDIPKVEPHRFTALQMMARRLGDLLGLQEDLRKLSGSYVDMLRTLVKSIDELTPYTVGYSELMARYAAIIAREMNLSQTEVKDIALAAYFSNIGLLGLSSDLLFKPGKYTTAEYERMKLHSEVGALIIDATIANHEVSRYVRYHHERYDGHGYPEGLRGEEIPRGSRIIAVVQTFLAKIKGREYREPLSFEKAVDTLKTVAGTQLDPDVVCILLEWFEKKQAEPLYKGRSLGACWEMNCAPLSICQRCPAYKRTAINCWECENTLCEEHGSRCETCYVYTEYLYRTKPGRMKNRIT